MDIVYQDSDMIVINKPPGVAVHPGDSVQGRTLVDFLLEKFPEIAGVGEDPARPGIVHRLDRDTSGIMVVARNQAAFAALKELFQNRLVQKTYHAIVCGVPAKKEGAVDLAIGRMSRDPTKRGAATGRNIIRGARPALTEYRVLKEGNGMALVELKPKTGRMHQLRVHMSALHHPIACDIKYGGKNVCCPIEGAGALPPRQLLHAQSLSFSYPSGHSRFFEADPPEDFALVLAALF